MPDLDIELRKELVYEVVTFVLNTKRFQKGDTPKVQGLMFCRHLMSGITQTLGMSPTDWFVQELKKVPRLWNMLAQFIHNNDGKCKNCPHKSYCHKEEKDPHLADYTGQLCRGGYRKRGYEKDESCKCPGYEIKPL